jgi:hypothetical protein
MRKKYLGVVGLIGLMVVITGCTREVTVVEPANTNIAVVVDPQGGGPQVGNLNISVAGGAQMNFRSDIPFYPGATSTGVVTTGTYANASLATGDSVDAVLAYYASAMPQNSWTVKTTLENPVGRTVLYAKDDAEATIVVATQSGQTAIAIAVAELP